MLPSNHPFSSQPNDQLAGGSLQTKSFHERTSENLEDDLRKLGMKIKQHEESIRDLTTRKNKLDGYILDTQVKLGKYQSSSVRKIESEEETAEQVLRHENSAAGILYQLKTHHGTQASHMTLTKDVLGVVALLGKVDDENLSRLLSEYLGVQNMLAIICRTYEGSKALEIYKQDGSIDKTSGLHGLAASMGRSLDGRFLVICLESLRPYPGNFVADDPQRTLDLLKPRLPNGECPPGFLGFAVNMIHVDSLNLSYVTSSGDGLRETLFYNLFSHLQVYRTRADMVHALPCIRHGAVSLDGGMIRGPGALFLGSREDVDVTFAKSSAVSDVPQIYIETDKKLKEAIWIKEKVEGDIKREIALVNNAKANFERKKTEFLMFLAGSSSYATQHLSQAAARDRSRAPR